MKLILILAFTLTLFTLQGQELYIPNYDIKEKALALAKDTVGLDSLQLARTKAWSEELALLYPEDVLLLNAEVDSVILVVYKKSDDALMFSKTDFFKRPMHSFIDRVYPLTQGQYLPVLEHLNDPENYSWSSCKLPVVEMEFQFYQRGVLQQRIVLACATTQVFLLKEAPVIRWGKLRATAVEKLVTQLQNLTKK